MIKKTRYGTNKTKFTLISFTFLISFSFFLSSFISNSWDGTPDNSRLNPPEFEGVSPMIQSIIEENLTVGAGQTVGLGIETNFNGSFYDDTDLTKEFSEAYLQTQLIGDDTIFNDTISNVNNSQMILGDIEYLSIQNGTFDNDNDMLVLDDDPTDFYSSLSEANYNLYDSDIDMLKGDYLSNGTIGIKDGDYHTFESTLDGIYNATFSFTNDANGVMPIEWVKGEDGCSFVVQESNSHSKVLQMYDPTTTLFPNAEQIFTETQTSGTVEFYIKTSNTAVFTDYRINSATDGVGMIVRITTGTIRAFDNHGGVVVIASASNNQWYHIRLDFECGADSYLGLSADTYQIYIDSVDKGVYNFYDPQVSLGKFYTYIYGAPAHYSYTDALGYSWDEDYEIGDNLNPLSCELNFTSVFHSDSYSYQYDNMTLYYSQITNKSQTINISVYNFDLLQWDLVNNSNTFDDFYLNSYLLNSSYFNSTDDLVININGFGITDNFELYLDLLQVRYEENFLNFTFDIPFLDREFLALNVSSYYMTDNEFQNVSFSIYDFTGGSWVLINNSRNSEDYFLSNYFNDTTPNDFRNGTGYIRLYFYAFNSTETITLSIDYLEAKSFSKLDLSYSKTFNIRGNWKYRFHLVGSDIYTTWIYFEVITLPDNVELISESDYMTRWDFLTDNSTEEVIYSEYFDNQSQGYWDLYNVANRDLNNTIIQPSGGYLIRQSSDGGLNWNNYYYPTTYNNELLNQSYSLNLLQMYSTIHNNLYLVNNYTDNTNISFYSWENKGDLFVDIKGSEDYQLDDILNAVYLDNMDIQPFFTIDDLEHDENNVFHLYNYSFYVNPYSVYVFNVSDLSVPLDIGYLITEGYLINKMNSGTMTYRGETIFAYLDMRIRIHNYLTKNYHGNGILYGQTNELETLNIRSPNNVSLDLTPSDKIRVIFNTTSSNQINLNLYTESGSTNSFTLSEQGNNNYNTQIKEFSISNEISFDGFEFSGLFDSEKNIIVESIEIIRRTPDLICYVDPDGIKTIKVDSGINYTVNVYENELIVYSVIFTSSYTLQTLIYEKIDSNQVYINYYDSNNEWLRFSEFKAYVNYTYGNETFTNKRLSENTLKVDSESSIFFTIYDSFDVNIKTYNTIEQTFIDITLNIFTLKVKNEAEKYINYTFQNNDSSIIKTGLIFSGEIEEYHIAIGIYLFNYTNQENSQTYYIDFELTENKLIYINTTFYDIYFGLFNFDGLGLDHNLFRFYIDSVRKDFGFNTLKYDTVNLRVLDYFNSTLFNQNVELSSFTEYNINIEVWTLIINNNYTFSVEVEIERSGIEISQVINAQTGFPFRFLPSVEYEIRIYHINGTLLEERTINLTKNGHIESFGFWSTELPFNPEAIILDFMTVFWFFIMVCILALVIILFNRQFKKDIDIRETKRSVESELLVKRVGKPKTRKKKGKHNGGWYNYES